MLGGTRYVTFASLISRHELKPFHSYLTKSNFWLRMRSRPKMILKVSTLAESLDRGLHKLQQRFLPQQVSKAAKTSKSTWHHGRSRSSLSYLLFSQILPAPEASRRQMSKTFRESLPSFCKRKRNILPNLIDCRRRGMSSASA